MPADSSWVCKSWSASAALQVFETTRGGSGDCASSDANAHGSSTCNLGVNAGLRFAKHLLEVVEAARRRVAERTRERDLGPGARDEERQS